MVRNVERKQVVVVEGYEIVRKSGEAERWISSWGHPTIRAFRPFTHWLVYKDGKYQSTHRTLKGAKHEVACRIKWTGIKASVSAMCMRDAVVGSGS